MNLDELRSKYSDLFADTVKFRCPEGWVSILDKYFDDVRAALPSGVKLKFVEVGEKYGALTIDIETTEYPASDIRRRLGRAENLADARSEHTCPDCGERGTMRDDGSWMFVACDRHSRNVKPAENHNARYGSHGRYFVYDELSDGFVELPVEPNWVEN
ncbi:hypothetical protein LJR231_002767 [Phyllobacterium sp. LjRoot231]|uniref:hypothetical protein n=1 Tax=Phyllobacterium sp. LjRoot231 TaxID=3342289 RepID=UPI003ECDB399